MLQPNKRFYTVQEYFAMEAVAASKNEYFDGEIFAMAGATRNHNRITVNLVSALNQALNDTPCEAFANDLRVPLEQARYYTYPDVVVVCGETEFAEKRQDTITNPVVIIEVLSDSTKDYDRGTKFAAYRKIPSLREYILVAQDEIHIEDFTKEPDGTWRLREYFENAELLALPALQMTIPVAEIYRRVELTFKPRLIRSE